MRYMMLMIPGGYADAAPDAMPSLEAIQTMMKYNKELNDAGVLMSLEGLHPASSGVRISFKGGQPLVTDGPFAEVKEVLGGYWILKVGSRDEAIAWARKCPAGENDVLELRQIAEMSEAPEEAQKLAEELGLE